MTHQNTLNTESAAEALNQLAKEILTLFIRHSLGEIDKDDLQTQLFALIEIDDLEQAHNLSSNIH